MEQKFKDVISEIAEEQGFSVSFDDRDVSTDVEFECYSNLGQDYVFTISVVDNNPDGFIDDLECYCDDYDYDEETTQWIGEDGHGKNCAPYRLEDVLNSAKEIGCKLFNLLRAFIKATSRLRDAARGKMLVQITETLQRIVEVDAYNEDDAIERAQELIRNDDVVLDYNDFVERDIEIYND